MNNDDVSRLYGRANQCRLVCPKVIESDIRWGTEKGRHKLDAIARVVADGTEIGLEVRVSGNWGRTHWSISLWNLGIKFDSPFHVPGLDKKSTVGIGIKTSRGILVQPMAAASEVGAIQVSKRYSRLFNDILGIDNSWECFSVIDARGECQNVWTERTREQLREVPTIVPWDKDKEKFLQSLAEVRPPALLDTPTPSAVTS